MTDADIRDSHFGKVAYDSIPDDVDSVKIKFQSEEAYYKLVKSDTTLLHLSVAADTAYIAKYNAIKASNTGRFEEVKDSIANVDYTTAASLLSGITPTNDMEYNKKYVLESYLSYFADTLAIDSATIATLETIANQHPLYGGEGVYFARAMLNLDIIDILPVMRERLANSSSPMINEKPKQELKGKFYPNPTSAHVTFTYPEPFSESSRLEIYNSMGVKVKVILLDKDLSQITFNTYELSTGIYSCRVFINNVFKQVDKLTIIR